MHHNAHNCTGYTNTHPPSLEKEGGNNSAERNEREKNLEGVADCVEKLISINSKVMCVPGIHALTKNALSSPRLRPRTDTGKILIVTQLDKTESALGLLAFAKNIKQARHIMGEVLGW